MTAQQKNRRKVVSLFLFFFWAAKRTAKAIKELDEVGRLGKARKGGRSAGEESAVSRLTYNISKATSEVEDGWTVVVSR